MVLPVYRFDRNFARYLYLLSICWSHF